MKLSVSNICINDEHKEKVYGDMRALGFTGLEIAPTKFISQSPYEDLPKAAQAAEYLLAEYGICIPSMQSIWYGKKGNIFAKEDKRELVEYTKLAIKFAKAVSCKNMVFGCPKNRNVPDEKKPESSLGFFSQIAKYAHENNTTIALEANVTAYGTNFMNTSKEAFAFAKKVPHLKVNYDVGTVISLAESLNLLQDNIALVSHIHISEPSLAPIEQRLIHKELAALLKKSDYDGFVSIEMKEQPYGKLSEILKYVSEVFL